MNFQIVSKTIYYYNNLKNYELKNKHFIKDLLICSEYNILFRSKLPLKSNSFIELTFFSEEGDTLKKKIKINSPYKLQNKIFNSMEIEIHLDKSDILFDLYVLEKPILFKENTYENSLKIKDFINKIDHLNTPDNKKAPTYNLKIACILDEFTYECFSYEANLLQLKSMTWQKQIESFKPDILLVESVWYGICKTWIEKIANDKILDDTIASIVKYCKSNNIPTIFFNKEGLVNLNYFKNASSIFDYVFVSDENIIPYQIEACHHQNIYTLSFASQPKIHNSINKNKFTLGKIAFAGGWYSTKHPDRLKDIEDIIKPALNFNIDIFDRNFHQRTILEFLNRYWPKEYLNYIVGRLDYNYMVEAYKNYDLFLNVNSIHDSSFMVSRRVYEILSSKTLVLSSYSQGIEKIFKDYILISKSKEETIQILNNLEKNKLENKKLAKKAQRYVLENHTYKNRLEEILDTIKFNYDKISSLSIGIISILNNFSDLENIIKNISIQNYNYSKIFLIINKNILYENAIKNLTFTNLNYSIFEYENNICDILDKIYKSSSDISYYTLLNPNNYYASNYIRDYVNTLSFVSADVIGKSEIYKFENDTLKIESIDNKDSYCNKLFTDTIFFNRKFFNLLSQNKFNLNENIQIKTDNFIFYSDDEFSFIKNTCTKNLISSSLLNIVNS